MKGHDLHKLKLSTRIFNLLNSAGIYSIAELVEKRDLIWMIEGIGKKSIDEINQKLAEYEGR